MIIAIFNRYKDILDDFIDSLDLNILPRLIDKRLCNMFKFRNRSTNFLKEDCLNKNISTFDKLL